MQSVDVAIVGAGPAGAATALSLVSAGHSVVLLENSSFAYPRVGETLSPEISTILMQLGIWEQFIKGGPRPTNGIWSAWDEPDLVAKDLMYNPYGTAWRVDRARFDGMLVAAAERKGARVQTDWGRIHVQREGSLWRLTAGASKSDVCVSSFVVDATGRSATVARSLGIRRCSRDRLVALIGIFCIPITSSGLEDVLLVEAAPEGWWYRSVLPSGEIVAAYLTDSDLVPRNTRALTDWWRSKLNESEFIRVRVAGLTLRAFHARPAAVSSLERAAGPGWIAVGDAANAIDPLSGGGITKALYSALLASNAVTEALSGTTDALEIYSDRCEQQFEHSLKVGALYYRRMVDRWPDSPFWRRRFSPGPPTDRN